MEERKVNYGELKHNKLIGKGSEARVYLKDNMAIKAFNQNGMKKEEMDNKINKIKELSKMDMDNFLLPKELVYTFKNKFIGYSMDYVEALMDMDDLMQSKNYTLDKKIEMLKKLENNIKCAHKNDIVLVDDFFWNFLVTEDNTIYMVDTDSYKVKQYKNDFEPHYYYDFYSKEISKNIDANLDKFQIGVHVLSYLTDHQFNKEELLKYPTNYLTRYIKSLDMPNEIKDFFYELTSPSKEKKYIDNNLDNLSSSKSFLKKY